MMHCQLLRNFDVSKSHMLSVIYDLSEGSATLIVSVMTDSPGVRSWYLQVYSSQIRVGETTTGHDFIQNLLFGFKKLSISILTVCAAGT